jgi:hypothetical protein
VALHLDKVVLTGRQWYPSISRTPYLNAPSPVPVFLRGCTSYREDSILFCRVKPIPLQLSLKIGYVLLHFCIVAYFATTGGGVQVAQLRDVIVRY